jgi:sortase A
MLERSTLRSSPAVPWLRWAERTAWVLALLLGGIWAGARGLGYLSKERSLAAFEVDRTEVSREAPRLSAISSAMTVRPRSVDQRLWDRGRVRAYALALTRPAPPPLAVLRIPRLRLEVPVLEGTDEWTLDRAVGHIAGTAAPGEAGNVGIAGHRDGFFRVLKDIGPGDLMELALPGGTQSYRVRQTSIVKPDDVSVLEADSRPAITLVTCYPFYFVGSAPDRFIVRAELAPENP